MKTMDDGHGLALYKCPVCGRVFEARRALWGYWYGGAMVCSYRCMRKLEKREEAGELAVTEEQGAQMRALYEGGTSVPEIARQMGYSGHTVRDQLRRLGVYRESRGKKTEAPEPAPEFTPEEAQRIATDTIPAPMGLTPEEVQRIAMDMIEEQLRDCAHLTTGETALARQTLWCSGVSALARALVERMERRG